MDAPLLTALHGMRMLGITVPHKAAKTEGSCGHEMRRPRNPMNGGCEPAYPCPRMGIQRCLLSRGSIRHWFTWTPGVSGTC
jgi:hypothetical protein